MSVMAIALREVGFKPAEELIPAQLANVSKSCRAAGELGYKDGGNFFKNKKKYICPYAKGSQEYSFWWRGFDSAKRDVAPEATRQKRKAS